MNTIKQFIKNELGIGSMFTALALTAIIAMCALAVDLGYLYMKRSELQNAADAAALAGAGAIISYGGDTYQSRSIALSYAYMNLSTEDWPEVAVTNSDVTFYQGATPTNYRPDTVEVTVSRKMSRNNAVALFFGKALGLDSVDLTATARAAIPGVCSSKCVKPFTIPAKFTWDDYADSNKKYKGNGKLDTDSSAEMETIQVFGYTDSDLGTQITLKVASNDDTVVPSHYNAIDLPPSNKGNPVTGGSMYRTNIADCSGSNSYATVSPGDTIQLEPGNMQGPTKQGLAALLSQDPYAYWSSCKQAIKGSLYDDPMASPRIVYIPFYDPRVPPVSGRNSVNVYQVGAVFIEGISCKGDVTARFIRAVAIDPDKGTDCNGLLRIVRMTRDTQRGSS